MPCFIQISILQKYRKPQMTQVDSSPVIYEEIKRRRSSGFGLHLMSGGTSNSVIKQGNLSKRSKFTGGERETLQSVWSQYQTLCLFMW